MNEERKGADKRSDTPTERLFRAIGGADAELVEEAMGEDPFGAAEPPRATPRRTVWRRWAAMAACAAIAVGAVWRLGDRIGIGFDGMTESAAEVAGESASSSAAAVVEDVERDPEPAGAESAPEAQEPAEPMLVDGLPQLTLEMEFGGMGFEGYMAYDVSELVNANPWTEQAELDALPVYRNVNAYNDYYRVEDLDLEGMEARLRDVAARLGLDAAALEPEWQPTDAELGLMRDKLAQAGEALSEYEAMVTSVEAEQDGVRIQVDTTLTTKIEFDPAVDLGEYNLEWYAPEEEVAATAEYLKTRFADLLAMKQPVTDLTGGDYNIYAQRNVDIEFYEGAGDLTEQIVNYNMNPIRLCAAGDAGEGLWLVWLYGPDLSGKLGDYPIVTAEEARALLNEGRYVTSVPYSMPGDEYVRKVELVYRAAAVDEYFVPYYRFYVELPEEQRDYDLKSYGAYYVPAVEQKYIANMPLWDGHIN